jgi:hypothetical protein
MVAELQAQLLAQGTKTHEAMLQQSRLQEQLQGWRHAQAHVIKNAPPPRQNPSAALDPRIGSTVPRQDVLRFHSTQPTSPSSLLKQREQHVQRRQNPMNIFAEVHRPASNEAQQGSSGPLRCREIRHTACGSEAHACGPDTQHCCDAEEQLAQAQVLVHAALKVRSIQQPR